MNGEYVMPPDAGPHWRAAHAMGIDMSLIEENLRLTPCNVWRPTIAR